MGMNDGCIISFSPFLLLLLLLLVCFLFSCISIYSLLFFLLRLDYFFSSSSYKFLCFLILLLYSLSACLSVFSVIFALTLSLELCMRALFY
ncbi:hypothetical protein F5Y00DRAFT_235921, partial [Daldinia vernicosa]|uniref:uncharacterized protein n=1 Tax=Daldinia vernicosa TaxID=114800 RepID=UPI00200876C9